MSDNQAVIAELERVKALFQLRGIIAAMGLEPNSFPELRGDHIKETDNAQ